MSTVAPVTAVGTRVLFGEPRGEPNDAVTAPTTDELSESYGSNEYRVIRGVLKALPVTRRHNRNQKQDLDTSTSAQSTSVCEEFNLSPFCTGNSGSGLR